MTALLSRLSLARKLLLLGALALGAVVLLIGLHVRDTLGVIRVVDAELAGFRPASELGAVIRLTQQHRGLSANVLGGKADVEPQRASRQADVDKALSRIAETLQADGGAAALREALQPVAKDWAALAPAVAGKQVDAAQSFQRHNALVARQIELHDAVLDQYGLTLDPEPATYFLLAGVMKQLPRLTELSGQARALGSLALSRQSISTDEKIVLAGLSERILAQLHDMRLDIDKSFAASPALKTALAAAVDRTEAQARTVPALARQHLLDPEALSYGSMDYFKACTEAIDALFKLNDEVVHNLEGQLQERRATEVRGLWISATASLVLVVLGLWMGTAIARSITGPAMAARDAARRIAGGDLSHAVPVGGQDEMGELLAAMREMQGSLSRVVGSVRGNAESVATASAQIAQGNQDLSQRTETQASALQQTAATMDELNATVRHNTDNAQQANQLARNASEVATQGGEVVAQVVHTMRDISESSRRIADIIGVIDGIAFQTNILALNAAVEAARAGEQGRGFAVVAGEVRSLAGRSAEAAREIKGLIVSSVERVEHGTSLVDQAGQTMGEVVASIRRVSDIVGEISSASVEQSSGVQQVGSAITQMDQVTQQNAALVEESAAAAESLRGQAQDLVQAVSVFRL